MVVLITSLVGNGRQNYKFVSHEVVNVYSMLLLLMEIMQEREGEA